MKKILITALVSMGLIFGISSASQAFSLKRGLENTGKNMANVAKRKAAQKAVNDKLSKETAKCSYPSKSATAPSCNVNKIIAALSAFHELAEGSGFANDVDVNITVYSQNKNIAKSRAYYMRDKVRSMFNSWDFRVYFNKGSDKLEIMTEVN